MKQRTSGDSLLAATMFEITRVRFEAFRDRFGRDPKPNEPLLFDPACEEPTLASSSQQALQVLSAAIVARVDGSPMLAYLGLEQLH